MSVVDIWEKEQFPKFPSQTPAERVILAIQVATEFEPVGDQYVIRAPFDLHFENVRISARNQPTAKSQTKVAQALRTVRHGCSTTTARGDGTASTRRSHRQ